MNTTTADPRTELQTIARQIEQWREAKGLSKSALLRQISGLNHKTHNKILDGEWEELRPENHVEKYRAAWRECERFDQRTAKETTLPELPPTAQVYAALCSLKLNKGNDRFMLILSEGGGGKTEALRYAETQIAGAVYVCGGATWISPRHAAGDILRALGVPDKEIPYGYAERSELLVQRLTIRPALLLLDEYHEAAPLVHNLLKLLINRTGCWIAVAAASSIWADVQAKSWAILRQMIHNRMDLRVTLPAPDSGAVEEYLEARLKIEAPKEKTATAHEWDKAFSNITQAARNHGLWAFVRKTAKAAFTIATLEDRKVTAADLTAAAAAVLKNTAGLSPKLNCYMGEENPAPSFLRAV